MHHIIAFLTLLSGLTATVQATINFIPGLLATSQALKELPDYNSTQPRDWYFTTNLTDDDPISALDLVSQAISGLANGLEKAPNDTHLNFRFAGVDTDDTFFEWTRDLGIYTMNVTDTVAALRNATINRSKICDLVGAFEQAWNATNLLNATMSSKGLLYDAYKFHAQQDMDEIQQHYNQIADNPGNCSGYQNQSDKLNIQHVSAPDAETGMWLWF